MLRARALFAQDLVLARLVDAVRLALDDLVERQWAQQGPGEEAAAEGEREQPRPEVDAHAGRLVDGGPRVRESANREVDAVEDEQAADDRPQVEQGALGAAPRLLGRVDQGVVAIVVLGRGRRLIAGGRHVGSVLPVRGQPNTTLRAMVAAMTPPPRTAGDLYQPRSPFSRLGERRCFGVSDHTRPRSSFAGLGCVTSDTATVTMASAMNAKPAPQNDAACDVPRLITPPSCR